MSDIQDLINDPKFDSIFSAIKLELASLVLDLVERQKQLEITELNVGKSLKLHNREDIRAAISTNLEALVILVGSNEFHVSTFVNALKNFVQLTERDMQIVKDSNKKNMTVFDEKAQGVIRDTSWRNNPCLRTRHGIYRFKPEVLEKTSF